MKFLSQINVNTEYTLPMVDGTNGQVLSTDGNGVAYWGTISAGSLTLDGLSDVILTSPSSDQMLRYGLRQGDTVPVWHNFTPNFLTPSSSINALNDVVITTAAAGQILQYNGSNWINATLSTVEYVSKVQHTVKAGVAITKGQAIYVTGSNGTNMIVGLASNASEGTSSKTMGLAASTAAINDNIFVVTEGLLAGLDTSTATAGDPVWLGTNGNLIFGLVNKPVAPAHLVYLGVVTRVQANNGEIFVSVQNGFELHEIHDVLISSPSTGQLLQRASDGLWKNWTPNFLTAHPGILAASSVDNSNGTVIQDITLEANGHVTGLASVNLDTRYYTESEIDSFFGGETEIAGYNRGSWDVAYNDKINSASFSTTTGVLTLTQQDTGTITVDLDGRYLEAEADTLATVTGRGATTTNAITTSTHTISNGYLILSGASSGVNPEIEFTDDSGFGVAGFKMRYGNSDGWTFYDSYWASGGGHRFRTSVASSTIEALTIANNGNVGVNTTNPLAKLDVVGHTYIRGGLLYVDTIAGYSVGAVSLAGSTNFIVPSGNIGIRTTTPQKFLDVNGSGIVASFGGSFSPGSFAGVHFGYSESHLNNDNYKKSAIVFERTDNHGQGGNASGKIHFLLNNIGGASATSLAHSVMVIDTNSTATQGSARVGIGTTSPNSTLDVNGAANATSFSSTALFITNADASGSLQPDQGDPANKIYSFRWQGSEGGYIDTDNKITFSGFKTPAGTSSQFLKANGTVDTNTYALSSHGHNDATTSAAGFMSATDKTKLDGIAASANNYSLPTATSTVLGGIKVGSNLSISNGVLSATDNDTVTLVGIDGDLSTGDIVLKGSGATTITKLGGTITISSTDTDTNTTYSAGTGLTLTGTTFSVTSGTFAAASHTHAASDITSGTLSTDRLPKQELGISIVGNFGQWQAHSAYTNFNTDVAYWGWNYVQGNTNAPHQISSQWYRGRFSLGNEYGFESSVGDYWMEIAIPRYNQSSTSGNLFVRTAENGVINGWQGVRAAYATDAAYAADAGYAAESGYSVTSGSVEWTNVQNKPATFQPSAHTHTISDVTGLQTALDGKLSSDSDSEQDVGGRYFRFNNGLNRINIDPRWNESGYDVDLGVFHMYSTTSAGVQWGRTGIALFSGSAYQYLTTKSGTTGIFLNNQEIIHSGNIGSQSVNFATSAGTANNLIGLGSIQSTSTGTSYTANYQVRENSGGGSNTNEIYAPQLAFHWSGVVASSIMMEASGRIAIRNNPGGSYENFAAAVITATGGNSTNWNTAYGWGNHSGLYLPISGGTLSGDLNTNSAIAFRDGAGGYSNIIRAAGYPSEGYSSSDKYWMEYRAYGGHHFVLNVDGGVGAGENSMDDFVVWQGAIDGDRLLELSNSGNLTIRGTFTESSSIRFKENITPLDPALDKVNQLEAVSYNKIGADDREVGLIAEDVAELFPEVVTYNEEGQTQGLNYSRLSVILLKAMQEQNAVIAALTERVNKLENK